MFKYQMSRVESKKIFRIKNSLKFYLRRIKLSRANLRKPTLSKIYTFLKSYVDFFNPSPKIVEQSRKNENPLGLQK